MVVKISREDYTSTMDEGEEGSVIIRREEKVTIDAVFKDFAFAKPFRISSSLQ